MPTQVSASVEVVTILPGVGGSRSSSSVAPTLAIVYSAPFPVMVVVLN